MNKFLSQPINKLQSEYKNYPAYEGVIVTEILKSISKKTPEAILKRTDLFEFRENYEALSEKTIPQLTDYLKTDVASKKAIDVLISIYILNGSKGNLGWTRQEVVTELDTPQDPYLDQDISFLLDQSDLFPTRQPEKLISKYIHGKRVMPPGSPFEGIYDINKGPYVIELCDNMSPFSTVRYQALKKGVQIFATTIAENVIAYYIGERPAKIMYLTATDQLIEKFSNTRLDPLINSCDLGDLIFSQTENIKSRKSGDKSSYKEFIGGTLALVSLQSPSGMRSESIKILIRDEITAAPRLMVTGESFMNASRGRVQAFVEQGAKIFDLSTPGLYGECLITDQYEKGDKRKFMVSCPMCKKYQWLCMGTEKSSYGLKGDYKAGRLIQGYYQCFHCHDAIFESSKIKLLESGYWEPTREANDKYFRSYHLPSFYSPGLATFTYIKTLYDEAVEGGDDDMRDFTNLYLGKAFKPSGERPKLESIYEIRSMYKSGTVPNEIMWLTMAGDVQQGRDIYKEHDNEDIDKEVKKFTKSKDYKKLGGLPRLEVEVVGHGADFRTASIIYKIFYGRINDHTSGAWLKLTEWIQETGLVFKRKDDFEFDVKMIFIDSGFGKYTDVVYNYCESLPMTYAIKGERELKQDKLKTATIDEMSRGNYTRFRLSTSGSYSFVLINTNYYKKNIYNNLKNISGPIKGFLPNSHITPDDYPDSYFKGLTAEEMKKDGSFHNLAQRPNEPLDLLGYNKCGSDFWIEGKILADREVLKRRSPGISKEKLREVINRTSITAKYEKLLRAGGW